MVLGPGGGEPRAERCERGGDWTALGLFGDAGGLGGATDVARTDLTGSELALCGRSCSHPAFNGILSVGAREPLRDFGGGAQLLVCGGCPRTDCAREGARLLPSSGAPLPIGGGGGFHSGSSGRMREEVALCDAALPGTPSDGPRTDWLLRGSSFAPFVLFVAATVAAAVATPAPMVATADGFACLSSFFLSGGGANGSGFSKSYLLFQRTINS